MPPTTTLQFALTEPPYRTRTDSATAEPPGERIPIETITLNGFEIFRPAANDGVTAQANEKAFIVKTPEGTRASVLVRIDDEAVNYVERLTRRRLGFDSSFWTNAAERLLSDYLWNESKIPPGARLILVALDRDQLLTAERWREAGEKDAGI